MTPRQRWLTPTQAAAILGRTDDEGARWVIRRVRAAEKLPGVGRVMQVRPTDGGACRLVLTIAGLRRAHPDSRIGVVWIDAHADIHSPFTTPSGNMHGMPLAVATGHDNAHHAIQQPETETADLWRWCQNLPGTGKPAIQLRDIIYVSVRDTEPAEEATIRAYGLPIVSTEEVRRIGGEAAARRCLDYLADCDLIYVSFDVDCMDATVFKGTGTPVLGGLWAHEALAINRTLLRDPRVCCWEICEINPLLDTLNTLTEVSLGIYQGVLEVLEQRL